MMKKPEPSPHDPPPLAPGLYLVATPIGNLRDITLRALEVLRGADLILCEDTRVTRTLLSAYQIQTKTQAFHDHTESQKQDKIIELLRAGRRIALVSDAGMPLISDPGYKLVRACRAAGIMVTTLPGASAPLCALQLSGLPSDAFSFIGFLPVKTKARKEYLKKWMNISGTLIAFETGPRLVAALKDCVEIFQNREAAVVRELTKLFEEVRTAPLPDLLAHYTTHGPPRGEIVLLIAPGSVETLADKDVDIMLRTALKTMKTKEAASAVAAETGLSKTALYERAVALSKT